MLLRLASVRASHGWLAMRGAYPLELETLRLGGARQPETAMRSKRKNGSVLGRMLLLLCLLLVANAAYLAAFGDPNLFYVINALLHPFLGAVVAVLFAVFLVRRRDSFVRGFAALDVGVIVLALAAIFGVYLAIVGMTRPHKLALYAHVGLAVLGLFLLLAYLRWLTRANEYGTAWRLSFSGTLACAGLYIAAIAYHHYRPNPKYIIRNPVTPPVSMNDEGGGCDSFMFPSSAQTPDGRPVRSEFFMNSESCQRCHADIYNQWFSSMHHFASFNNQWYRKSVEYMQDTIGVKSSLWCGGCHDHALILAGKMQQRHIREMVNTPEAQNGLGCMSCHAIVHVDGTMGQGGFTIEYPSLSELAASNNPVMRWLHDYAVKLNPKPHRNAFLKPFHKQNDQVAKFCSSCHKVHLDVPVNNYRWIRGFDDYDNWQASGVSGQGARSFYYPPTPQQCADCHMPMVPSKDFGNIQGLVHSHRFAAANTAVPTSYDDTTQTEAVEKFLKGALSVDIFALAEEPPGPAGGSGLAQAVSETPRLSSTFAVGEESSSGLGGGGASALPLAKLMAPLGRAPATLHRDETVRVEVVVRTRRLGHFFPAGTVDVFDCWLELEARDSKGRVIFWSGMAEDNGQGPVEPGAHFYRSLQLDAHANMINKRNAWSTRAVLYAHLIPPGAADTAHFRLRVPEDCGDTLTLTAKLNYRKFSWWNTQFAFSGVRDPSEAHPDVTKNYDDGRWVFTGDVAQVSAKFKRIPDLPTVVIAANTVSVPVGARNTAPFAETLKLDSSDRERWNDYGIGLLLQGDLKGAERAFAMVTKLDPQYADGWVNVARARIQEGNTDAAKPNLIQALGINPSLASARYFYGLALKADGDYPSAYEQFARAASLYPSDRVVRNQMGRMLFLQRKYRQAVKEYARTLSVDPEDLEAHYNLMLCYRGLNDDAHAATEEKLYLRFKADEAARAITGPYALAHAEDNNEAQPIHEHVSVALGRTEGRKQYAQGGRPRGRGAASSLQDSSTGGNAFR